MAAVGAPVWTAAERESFFAAIARHRRAARQVSLVAAVGIAILALAVATLTAPLFYALIGLLLDIINLIVPMPDLLDSMMETLGAASDHFETQSAASWLKLALLAAVPGLLAVLFVLLTLRRIVREAEASGAQDLALRSPNPGVLSEQQLANVVGEMAIAANIKAPKVAILDTPAVNAAVYGPDDESVTVLVSTGLLEKLNRAQTQAIAGHLIGLIANGDIVQGMRVAQALSLFGFVARLSDGIVDPPAWSRLWQTLREALKKGASSADSRLILELTNPFGNAHRSRPSSKTSNELTWREWIRMPLYGPIVFSGFFGGLVSSVFLEPLLAVIWRRRKYLADAIAVQLTRDPQALSSALDELSNGAGFPAWCSHMLVAGGAHPGGLLSGSSTPMYPPHDKRLKALARMGASVDLSPPPGMPAWMKPLIATAGVLIVLLLVVATYLLVMISLAFSGLFTLLPTMILHAILR